MIAPLALALVAAQVLSPQSSFPETAVRALATLRPGVTPAAWLQGSPRDRLARFTGGTLARYRRALALDPSSAEARAAWLDAWRLAAGLAPAITRYFCVYD